MAITIREANASDSPFIQSSQISMARETEGLELDAKTVEWGVNAVMTDAAKGRYYVAEDAGQTLACLLTIPEWSDWRNGTVIWIHSVYVVPTRRNHGVFRQMYAHLRRMVEASPDLRGLRLYVDKQNEIAKSTYRKLGMSAEHYELYEWLK